MISKHNGSPHHRRDRYEDSETDSRKSRRKNDWIREERKRAKEFEENYFRRVRDFDDVAEDDLDDLA